MIPKKIHYCWFGGKPLPNDVKRCIKSWKKFCPEFEIIEWNESNYDISKHTFVEKAYESKKWAFVSDYVRLDVIYEHGGIYLDTDVELLKNLDFILNEKCYFAIQQKDCFVATGLGFGAEPKHFLVYEMLKQYDQLDFNINSLSKFACPILNTNALVPFGFEKEDRTQTIVGAKIYESLYFDPIAPGTDRNLLCNDSISIHHYSASWTSKSNILKRRLFRMIGQNNILKLKSLLMKFHLLK